MFNNKYKKRIEELERQIEYMKVEYLEYRYYKSAYYNVRSQLEEYKEEGKIDDFYLCSISDSSRDLEGNIEFKPFFSIDFKDEIKVKPKVSFVIDKEEIAKQVMEVLKGEDKD